MEKYLIELIDRMCDDSDQNMVAGYDSSTTISWKATREAEKLTEELYIKDLIQFIEKEKNKKKRDKAYFILSKIAKNIENLEAMEFLIHRIEKETDKYVLMSMLDRIAELNKPNGTNLTNIIKSTENEKWQIRHSAIEALKKTNDEMAEITVLNILDNTDDKHNIIYCISTLYSVGTEKAIPHLESHLTSRTRDIKSGAENAIKEIKNRIKSTNA
jgi:DNA phosphorothioation-dependent restriction protein DptG